MKKTLSCVMALATGLLISQAVARAQTPPAGGAAPPVRQVSANAPAPGVPAVSPAAATGYPGTRVAVVNINAVLKNYNKAQNLNNSIRTRVQTFATQMNAKREEVAKLQAELAKPTTTPQMRESIEKQIVNLQRSVQDIDNEARKTIGKEQGDIAVMIYREIEGVIKAVATTNGFDLVLSYPDATEPTDLYSQDNVVRKLASQAAMPLFYKPHIDITDAVTKTLNASYPVTSAAAPAAAPATPAAPR